MAAKRSGDNIITTVKYLADDLKQKGIDINIKDDSGVSIAIVF